MLKLNLLTTEGPKSIVRSQIEGAHRRLLVLIYWAIKKVVSLAERKKYDSEWFDHSSKCEQYGAADFVVKTYLDGQVGATRVHG